MPRGLPRRTLSQRRANCGGSHGFADANRVAAYAPAGPRDCDSPKAGAHCIRSR